MTSTALSLILVALKLATSWLEWQDAEKLRNSGKLEAVARASRTLQAKLEKVRDVDQAIYSGDDPAWVDRLHDMVSARGTDSR